MEAFSLFELNEHIRRVIALNFQEAIWVRCEISQVKKSRGHYYLDLVEKVPDQDEILAQMSGVIWAKTAWVLQRKLKDVFDSLLQDGMEARLRIRVDFHERYGIKLIIEDIDPVFTLGNIELRRREIIGILSTLDLLDRNSQIPMPLVAQRIAVLSAEQAAGYQDFRKHLLHNTTQYRYWIDLYPIAMQGMLVETELLKALDKIAHAQKHYDCVVIIRGGGSKLDLAAFDSLAIGMAIAGFPLPVLTGIGHEIDNTVTDIVAHTSLKTPTAVADFLTELNAHFDNAVNGLFYEICQVAQRTVKQQKLELSHMGELIRRAPRELLLRHNILLSQMIPAFQSAYRLFIQKQIERIAHSQILVESLDPTSVMQRGFSITTKNGVTVRSSAEIADGDELVTHLYQGRIQSTVKSHE
jgi:exodeoxyribonuclease VII large subunit